MAKFIHKITTTEQVTIEGLVDTNGAIIIDGEPKDITETIKSFIGENIKIVFTKKTEDDVPEVDE